MALRYGVFWAVIALAMLCGCPQPLKHAPSAELAGTAPAQDGNGAPAADELDTPDAPDAPDAAPAQLGTETPETDPTPEANPAAPPEAAAPSYPGNVGPQQPGASAVQGGPGGAPGNAGPNPPAAQYGALDAENFTGQAAPAEDFGQPQPSLSKDAQGFAGRWQVAVVNQAGTARLLADPDAWVLSLETNGNFYAKQLRGEQTWRQQGSWTLSGEKLKLNSGPGGERVYELSQELDNICVLRDSARGTSLFCFRNKGGAAVAVGAKYESDFGVLNLRPSGPAHWRGSYGAPQGTLLLAQLGGFLAGTWEQSPGRGFVIYELRPGGLAGAWWYEKSTGFDGRWFAVAAK